MIAPQDSLNPKFSPILWGSFGGLPPALIMTAEYDPLWDQGEAYADRLSEAGVHVTGPSVRGVTHGFTALEDATEGVHLADNDFSKESERGVLWNGPQIGVKWPVKDSVLSEKDKEWPTLKDAWTFS